MIIIKVRQQAAYVQICKMCRDWLHSWWCAHSWAHEGLLYIIKKNARYFKSDSQNAKEETI
ncbi:hypothetical protein D5274_08715 [bacterium 1XD42-94]|nr:hypothetical protein [bacterium 1XD42-76]NBK05225.1 hypothetical protein [bacterium 1XD42-94]